MIKMKKLAAVVLALMMAVLCLTACGDTKPATATPDEVKATDAATEAQTEEATEAPTTEEVKEEKVTERIPYGTQEAYSDSMEEGASEITTLGVDGEKEITYKVTYVDGKETAREKISEKIVKEPVDEVITYGTASYSNNGGVYEVSRDDYPDCDGSGHGYYEIHYSDGSTEYVVY